MPQKIPDSPADILQNDSENLFKKMEWVQLRENTAGATQTHLPDYRLSRKVADIKEKLMILTKIPKILDN